MPVKSCAVPMRPKGTALPTSCFFWPGALPSYFAKKAPGQKKREVGQAVPFGRMGTAADLTGMAIFLAAHDAKYIVAQCFGVDGGNWMA